MHDRHAPPMPCLRGAAAPGAGTRQAGGSSAQAQGSPAQPALDPEPHATLGSTRSVGSLYGASVIPTRRSPKAQLEGTHA